MAAALAPLRGGGSGAPRQWLDRTLQRRLGGGQSRSNRFTRFAAQPLWKMRSLFRPRDGGSSMPSLRRNLFKLAQAWISVPWTEKCSSDGGTLTGGRFSTAAVKGRRDIAAAAHGANVQTVLRIVEHGKLIAQGGQGLAGRAAASGATGGCCSSGSPGARS